MKRRTENLGTDKLDIIPLVQICTCNKYHHFENIYDLLSLVNSRESVYDNESSILHNIEIFENAGLNTLFPLSHGGMQPKYGLIQALLRRNEIALVKTLSKKYLPKVNQVLGHPESYRYIFECFISPSIISRCGSLQKTFIKKEYLDQIDDKVLETLLVRSLQHNESLSHFIKIWHQNYPEMITKVFQNDEALRLKVFRRSIGVLSKSDRKRLIAHFPPQDFDLTIKENQMGSKLFHIFISCITDINVLHLPWVEYPFALDWKINNSSQVYINSVWMSLPAFLLSQKQEDSSLRLPISYWVFYRERYPDLQHSDRDVLLLSTLYSDLLTFSYLVRQKPSMLRAFEVEVEIRALVIASLFNYISTSSRGIFIYVLDHAQKTWPDKMFYQLFEEIVCRPTRQIRKNMAVNWIALINQPWVREAFLVLSRYMTFLQPNQFRLFKSLIENNCLAFVQGLNQSLNCTRSSQKRYFMKTAIFLMQDQASRQQGRSLFKLLLREPAMFKVFRRFQSKIRDYLPILFARYLQEDVKTRKKVERRMSANRYLFSCLNFLEFRAVIHLRTLRSDCTFATKLPNSLFKELSLF